jgi:hypothetical protein
MIINIVLEFKITVLINFHFNHANIVNLDHHDYNFYRLSFQVPRDNILHPALASQTLTIHEQDSQ